MFNRSDTLNVFPLEQADKIKINFFLGDELKLSNVLAFTTLEKFHRCILSMLT